jgi:hypothetical protein
MKGKKLVSILTAGALAATMAMPVMAADGGTIDVEVTTKTGILRVEVPTTLAIAVDQFETTDAGSQVYSEEFTIANKSEVNVVAALLCCPIITLVACHRINRYNDMRTEKGKGSRTPVFREHRVLEPS